MTGKISGTQTNPPTVPSPESAEQQSTPSNGIAAIDAKPQLPGSDGIDSTPIAERTVTAIKKNGSSESGFYDTDQPLLSEGDYVLLKDLLTQSGKKRTLAELEKYYAGCRNFSEIKEFLNDSEKTPTEKAKFLLKTTRAEKKEGGLVSHMGRRVNPTSPGAVLMALQETPDMLRQMLEITTEKIEKQISQAREKDTTVDTDLIRQKSYQELVKTLEEFFDTKSGPCFEARMRHTQEVYSKFLSQSGVVNDNIIDPDDALNPAHDPEKIINDKCGKYMERFPEELEDGMIMKEKFTTWVKKEKGLMGFKAAGTVITKKVIEDCVQKLADDGLIAE